MRMFRCLTFGIAAMSLFFAAPAAGWAQRHRDARVKHATHDEQEAASSNRRDGANDSNANYSATDRQLAAWLTVDNEGEVALARLAQERSKNDQVRKFAAQMIKDHEKCLDHLKRIGGGSSVARDRGGRAVQASHNEDANQERDDRDVASRHAEERDSSSRPDEERDAENRSTSTQPVLVHPSSRPDEERDAEHRQSSERGSSHGLDFVQIKRQIGQECIASSQRELSRLRGAEFDRAYMGMQVGKHYEMLDTLRVFNKYASADFDKVIVEAEKSAETHLDHAKQLHRSLEGHDSGHRNANEPRDESRSARGGSTSERNLDE